jgi:hypothetical protein
MDWREPGAGVRSIRAVGRRDAVERWKGVVAFRPWGFPRRSQVRWIDGAFRIVRGLRGR